MLEERDAREEAREVAHPVCDFRIRDAGEELGTGELSCVEALLLVVCEGGFGRLGEGPGSLGPLSLFVNGRPVRETSQQKVDMKW